MERWKKTPLKLYIQDIFRAKQSQNNKYVYEMFGIKFKNVLLHGVVTALYNTSERWTNFELSDPTGTVQVYYNFTKSNKHVNPECMKDIIHSLAKVSNSVEKDLKTMSFMLERIEKRNANINFREGDYVSVLGDIFVDDLRDSRMISGFDCNKSSIERDILWMEEMRFIYDKSYIK
ncbi:uncharacterized protein LOC119836055 [Zerene cesonia]|uniref:uncharacterized protein LOC119836055 n=1 Tax=Zerene cesonia TaxID=33412 RepID=UPI0018E5A167|nr:uncharacterized protein LOC119836055 [Zerene cesonia]